MSKPIEYHLFYIYRSNQAIISQILLDLEATEIHLIHQQTSKSLIRISSTPIAYRHYPFTSIPFSSYF